MIRSVIMTEEGQEAARSLDLDAGRRAFIQNLGVGAVGAAVFAAAAGVATPAAAATADVLNFALNLEYLEATFYNFAAYGTDLGADVIGAVSGPVSGGAAVPFQSSVVRAYAQEIAVEEKKHVQVLRKLLGGSAVNRPALNIGTAFAAAATAAGIDQGAKFNAYASDTTFLLASYIFEDVGVTAYHGAAALLINDKTALNYAAGILAVEAYHAALVRTSLFALKNSTVVQDTQLISRLRSRLANGQPGVDDVGVGVPSNPTLVPVDSNAIAFARSPQQVLNIVYGNRTATNNATSTPGLFFPSGLNGAVR